METIASRYLLEEKIGAGGEARIFRAHDLKTGDEVAIRFSSRDDSSAAGREAPAPHSGWVRLLDRGVAGEHGPFTVFELLRGETLGAMTTHSPLSPKAWLDFARQSLDSVGALHRAGWVHGDLNADNFLLHNGTTWKLLELPFHQAAPVEKRSPLFGSIYTLAPEQLASHLPDIRSDLYALGCLYYKAATGIYPHAGGTEADIAVERLRFPATPIIEIASDFPVVWAASIMRLLERDPADRPVDAEAARQLLESATDEA
jgi:serine/threonine protein kinase